MVYTDFLFMTEVWLIVQYTNIIMYHMQWLRIWHNANIHNQREHTENILGTCEEHSKGHVYKFFSLECKVIILETAESSGLSFCCEKYIGAVFQYLEIFINREKVGIHGIACEGIVCAEKPVNTFEYLKCSAPLFYPRVIYGK